MPIDNPAANLYTLLKLGKETPRENSCIETWHVILQTGADLSVLLSRLGSAMKLPFKTIGALEKLYGQGHAEQWSYWSGSVNNAFLHQQLVGKWSTFIDQVDSHAMGYLELASSLLRQANPSDVIDSDKVLLVRAQAEALIQQIIESNIDAALKIYVLDALRRLLATIDEIFLNGSEPIISEVESTMGHILIDEEYKKFLGAHPLGKEMVNVLAETAKVVTAKNNPQLARAIQHLAISM